MDIKKTIHILKEIFMKGFFDYSRYRIIGDLSKNSKTSNTIRNHMLQTLKELNRNHNCFPGSIYLFGTDIPFQLFMKTSKTASEQNIVFINNLHEAFGNLETFTDSVEAKRINRKYIRVKQEEINLIGILMGKLLWKNPHLDYDNRYINAQSPLYQLTETLNIVKNEITDLRNNDKRQYMYLLKLFESIQTGLIIVDEASHGIMFANSYAADMVQTNPEAMEGVPRHNFICPTAKIHNPERLLLRTDGSTCPILLSENKFLFKGRPCLLETFTDITSIKKAHAETKALNNKLKESETNFKAFFNTVESMIFVENAENEILYVNPVVPRKLEYSEKELLSKNLIDLYSSSIRKEAEKTISAMKNGENNISTLPFCTKRGETLFVQTKMMTGKWNGKNCFFIISKDLTEQQRIMEELEESRERLNLALIGANDGVWDWNPLKEEALFGPRCYTMAGYEPNEFGNSFPEWFRRVHPEDKKNCLLFLKLILTGKNESFRKEFRFKCRDLTYIWILARGRAVGTGELKNTTRYVGTFTDITERKESEQQRSILNNLQTHLLKQGSLKEKAEEITDTVILTLDADFARIWLFNPGDICKNKCIHYNTEIYKNCCRKEMKCLHLISSSGRYTHIDGLHRRIPTGPLNKIGEIFTRDKANITTNALLTDPLITDHEWAEKLGLKSFSGLRLTNSKGEKVGVLALFSKKTISPKDESFLKIIGNLTSQVILNTKATSDLKVALYQTERANNLMEGREIRIRQIKDEVNTLANELGRKSKYESGGEEEGSGFSNLNTQDKKISIKESRENALSLAEDAEIARREVIEANQQLSLIRQAVNSSSDAIAISIAQGDFFYLNETFTSLFGFKVNKLAAISNSTIFKNEQDLNDALKATGRGIIWQSQIEMVGKAGNIIPVFMRVAPFRDERKRVLGMIWNFTDISKQKAAEKQITQYTRAIEESLAENIAMLKKARQLQKNFIQTTLPSLRDFAIHGLFMPCENLGGDFFNITKGIRDDKLAIIIGDCTDHGLRASMDASLLSSIVNNNIHQLYIDNLTDRFLNRISVEYSKYADEDQFPTMFAAIIDLKTRSMYYSNANGERPYLIRKNCISRLQKTSGMHIGYFDDPDYKREIFQFKQGDRLLFYSDAVLEIEKKNKSRLGNEGLEEILVHGEINAHKNFEYIIKSIKNENGSLPLKDDTTLIQIDFIEPLYNQEKLAAIDELFTILERIKSDLYKFDYSSDEIERINIGLEELCMNAITHGNKLDESKKVIFTTNINFEEARFSLKDEGDGFNPGKIQDPVSGIQEIMDRDIEQEYTHGRGIWIARHFLDSISYNEKGNEVTVIKKREREPLRFN